MLLALQRWSMDQHLTPDELDRARGLETNFSNCIASINDLYSYRKEVLASRTLHPEGATIFSAVQVIADETHLPTSMAERVLWTLLREQEKHHDQMAEELCNVAGETPPQRLRSAGGSSDAIGQHTHKSRCR